MNPPRPPSATVDRADPMPSGRSFSVIEQAMLRGVVWALVGAIFGSLFVMLAAAANARVVPPFDLLLATVAAAALTALFYGSMRLTVMVANFTFITMLVYSWTGPTLLDLQSLVFMGGGVGIAVGVAYGYMDKRSRVFCAEAKIIAGMVAGSAVASLLLVLIHVVDGISVAALAMIAAPLGILAYLYIAAWFIARCHRLLPAVVNGGLVGLVVGGTTGLVFLIMAGTLDDALLGNEALRLFVADVETAWVVTALGCAAACFPVGVARAAFKLPWYDM